VGRGIPSEPLFSGWLGRDASPHRSDSSPPILKRPAGTRFRLCIHSQALKRLPILDRPRWGSGLKSHRRPFQGYSPVQLSMDIRAQASAHRADTTRADRFVEPTLHKYIDSESRRYTEEALTEPNPGPFVTYVHCVAQPIYPGSNADCTRNPMR